MFDNVAGRSIGLQSPACFSELGGGKPGGPVDSLSVARFVVSVLAPRRLVLAAALLACALAVSGATLLILELDRPLT